MSLIQTTSNVCAKWLSTKVPNTEYETVEDQIQVYSYGFQVIVGALVKGVLLVAISYLLGVIIPALIITLTFSSLRIIAGGYHMKTYSKCIGVSLGMFIIAALIAQYTYQHWTNTHLLILLILTVISALYIIIRYVPRDTPTKPITKETEIKKFKKWSFVYLIIWSTIMVTCLYFGWNLIVISSCFGLILELFSISNLGYKIIYPVLDTN